jgi:hypothetical protein
VPDAWLARVRAYWEQSGKSLETLGAELSLLLPEDKPVSPSRLHQYISGAKTTAEMTAAFAKLMGVPQPALGIDDSEIVAWCDVGQRLKGQAAERFREELAVLTELVEALEKHRRRR